MSAGRTRRAPGRSPLAVVIVWDGVRGLFKLLLVSLYRLRTSGAEHVPREGPLVFVSNHQSHFDPVIVGILVHDRPFSSLARSSLFAFKPFAWMIRIPGAIPLKRGTSDTAAMRAAIGELEEGRCVLVFPEGTRTPDGAMREFRPGVLLLVRRTEARIVPVALEGAHDIWPKGRSGPRLRGRLAVKAGPPMDAAYFRENGAQALAELQGRIDAMRLELRAELREATGGSFPPPGPGDAAVAVVKGDRGD